MSTDMNQSTWSAADAAALRAAADAYPHEIGESPMLAMILAAEGLTVQLPTPQIAPPPAA